MALDFQFPQAQPLQEGLFQPLPISLRVPRKGPSVTIPVNIGWADYGASSVNPVAVEIDLERGASPGLVLDEIRSVYIDNSFSFVPIFVRFPGTQFMIICPANSIAWLPVAAGIGVRKAVAYAQDFIDSDIPVTTIHFCNEEVAGFVISTGEFTPPVVIPSIVRIGDYTIAANGTVTVSGVVDLGTEDATRCVYIAVGARSVIGTIDISSASIGGNAMTLMRKQNAAAPVGQSQRFCIGIYGRVVAAGTFATFSVTFSQIPDAIRAQVFAGYNAVAPLVNIDSEAASGATIGPLSLQTGNPGIALAAAGGPFSNNITGIGNVLTANAVSAGAQATTGAALPLAISSGYGGTSLVGVSVV